MLQSLVKSTRCFRRFYQNKPLDGSTLISVVNLLRFVSSARNAQPLKYIISTDKSINEEIFKTLSWAGYLKNWDGPEEGEKPSGYIVFLRDTNISAEDFSLIDTGIALQTAMLKLTEDGYGSCPIAAIDKKALRKVLSIPLSLEILLVLAVGKPKERVVITNVRNGDIKYYRDKNGVHYVPKRALKDVLLKTY